MEKVIPKDQAGFQKDRNCCNTILALTNFIELGYENCLKTGVVFLDLSAAFDTVWKRGLMCKLSYILPCQATLTLLMNMLSDRKFQVDLNGKTSRNRVLNNGLPQGSVISCILYCLYTSDIPEVQSRLFIYADDIAIAFQAKTFEEIEAILNSDLQILSNYFNDWRLKPNTTKTVSCVFHLNNQQANRELKLQLNGKKVEHEKFLKYLGIYLDRALTYRHHLEKTKGKLKSRE